MMIKKTCLIDHCLFAIDLACCWIVWPMQNRNFSISLSNHHYTPFVLCWWIHVWSLHLQFSYWIDIHDGSLSVYGKQPDLSHRNYISGFNIQCTYTLLCFNFKHIIITIADQKAHVYRRQHRCLKWQVKRNKGRAPPVS